MSVLDQFFGQESVPMRPDLTGTIVTNRFNPLEEYMRQGGLQGYMGQMQQPSFVQTQDPRLQSNPYVNTFHQAQTPPAYTAPQRPQVNPIDVYNQNTPVLLNGGWMAKHPRVANALESALFTVANIGPSATIGEGISNVARGLIGGEQQRRDMRMHPYEQMMKFAQAQQQFDLNASQMRENDARANYYNQNAGVDKYGPMITDKDGLLWQRNLRDGNIEPVLGADGKQMVSFQQTKADNQNKRTEFRNKGSIQDYISQKETELGRQLDADEIIAATTEYNKANAKAKAAGRGTGKSTKFDPIDTLTHKQAEMQYKMASAQMNQFQSQKAAGQLLGDPQTIATREAMLTRQLAQATQAYQESAMYMTNKYGQKNKGGGKPQAQAPTYSPNNPFVKKR